jgi:16S rRNA (adenine1518-N6/adenine1519-N6)-dimethyltransferase
MTLPLLECVKQLNVIEIDKDLITMLNNLNKDNLIVHQGDALKFDLSTLTTPLRVKTQAVR